MRSWSVIAIQSMSIFAVVLITGCSAALVPQQGKIASGQVVTCKSTTATGSNLPRKVCKSEAERAAERDDSQRTLEERVFRPNGAAGSNPASSL
jgi:hypothetical protein